MSGPPRPARELVGEADGVAVGVKKLMGQLDQPI